MTTALVVVGIVSAVVSVVTSMTASGAQMAAAKEEKKIGGLQAEAAEKQARLAAEANEIKIKQHRQNIRRILASQRAQVGASGLTGMGSPLEAYQFTKAQGEQDLNLIRKQGALEVQTMTDQARIIRRQTSKSYKMSQWGAVLTGLGGAGQALGQVGGAYNATPRTTTTSPASPSVSSPGYTTTASGFSYPRTRYAGSPY